MADVRCLDKAGAGLISEVTNSMCFRCPVSYRQLRVTQSRGKPRTGASDLGHAAGDNIQEGRVRQGLADLSDAGNAASTGLKRPWFNSFVKPDCGA